LRGAGRGASSERGPCRSGSIAAAETLANGCIQLAVLVAECRPASSCRDSRTARPARPRSSRRRHLRTSCGWVRGRPGRLPRGAQRL